MSGSRELSTLLKLVDLLQTISKTSFLIIIINIFLDLKKIIPIG